MYRLVIIEDETIIRNWLRFGIDYTSIDILVVGNAKDGKAGIDLIKNCQPDIVLTDINMPIMNAFEMFEATSDYSYAKVILSGYADFPNAKNAIKYGVFEFLAKPVSKNELLDCFQRIISRLENRKELNIKEDEINLSLPLPKINDQSPDIVIDILSWIHAHFQEKIVIKKVAHELGYSESYIYQIIKKHLQMTLSEYINQYRINQAIQLMQNEPHLMVYQIAEAVGIYDYRYFDRVFKKYLGESVKSFRERYIPKEY